MSALLFIAGQQGDLSHGAVLEGCCLCETAMCQLWWMLQVASMFETPGAVAGFGGRPFEGVCIGRHIRINCGLCDGKCERFFVVHRNYCRSVQDQGSLLSVRLIDVSRRFYSLIDQCTFSEVKYNKTLASNWKYLCTLNFFNVPNLVVQQSIFMLHTFCSKCYSNDFSWTNNPA